MPVGWAVVIVALWIAFLFLAIIVFGILRQVTPHLERAAVLAVRRPEEEGPPVGSRLSHFVARGEDDQPFTEEHLLGDSNILLFSRSECSPCENLAGEMRSSDIPLMAAHLTIVTDAAGRRDFDGLAGCRVIRESAREVQEALGIRGVPFAIAIDGNGVVRAKQPINTVAQLSRLAASVIPPTIDGWLGMPQPARSSNGNTRS